MKLCSNNCIPCCDFCKHVVHGSLDIYGTTGPIGCTLHLDAEHQEISEWCGYYDDFYCACVEE